MFVFWKSEPPKPAKAPPKERPVDAAVVVAVVPPKLLSVKPVDAIKSETVSLQKEIFLSAPQKIQNTFLKKLMSMIKLGLGKNYSIKYTLKNKEKYYLQSKSQ